MLWVKGNRVTQPTNVRGTRGKWLIKVDGLHDVDLAGSGMVEVKIFEVMTDLFQVHKHPNVEEVPCSGAVWSWKLSRAICSNSYRDLRAVIGGMLFMVYQQFGGDPL